jgi:hypothetical protein
MIEHLNMSDTSRAFPLLASLLATLVSLPAAARELVVYPPPQSESAFEDCSVEVNGKPVFVYMATVNRSAPGHGIVPETVGFASFDFSGDARVKVTVKEDFGPKGVQIHPQSFTTARTATASTRSTRDR